RASPGPREATDALVLSLRPSPVLALWSRGVSSGACPPCSIAVSLFSLVHPSGTCGSNAGGDASLPIVVERPCGAALGIFQVAPEARARAVGVGPAVLRLQA